MKSELVLINRHKNNLNNRKLKLEKESSKRARKWLSGKCEEGPPLWPRLQHHSLYVATPMPP
ncbi:hypothetical protein EPI10_006484 [Gossypium australe]|uniref:Uncharacterized protein n=1 Tax=Gossypium australe TaxID=47621 RepID=A0A5B6WRC5_9ROSI|nr:hypothetical protein EPI10_006484 [Gossypium australe]